MTKAGGTGTPAAAMRDRPLALPPKRVASATAGSASSRTKPRPARAGAINGSSDVARTAEDGKNVLMKLEPDRVDGVEGRRADELRLPAVDRGDAVGQPADIGGVSGNFRDEVTQRFHQPFHRLDDPRLGSRVAVRFLPVAYGLDELIVDPFKTIVPRDHLGVGSQTAIVRGVAIVNERGPVGKQKEFAVRVHRPAALHRLRERGLGDLRR